MREKNGFSLMEMMVVLLIMSIIAAATAPIVSKKMMQSSKSNASPWVFTGQGKNIAYNMGGLDNATAIIGAAKVPEGTNARLYIDCGNNASQIALGSGDTAANILADPVGKRVGIFSAESDINVPNNSVAIGMDQSLSGSDSVTVGKGTQTSSYAVAVGLSADASKEDSTAIGYNAKTTGELGLSCGAGAEAAESSLAVGAKAKAKGGHSIAIGAATTMSTADYAAATDDYAIAIGSGANSVGEESICIGKSAVTNSAGSIAIGTNAKTTMGTGAGAPIAIGEKTVAGSTASIAIGSHIDNSDSGNANRQTKANGHASTAIGGGAQASGSYSIALGCNSTASYRESIAIGYNAKTTASNQIELGTTSTTVHIPGNLVVDGATLLGRNRNRVILYGTAKQKFAEFAGAYGGDWQFEGREGWGTATIGSFTIQGWVVHSDKRLKNIGEKFTAGLDELKKLDFFHYTFKKDEAKTPHVGVIAQDLQKVFPDAVTKDEDGYLKIRFEDMFYAVINAVKELDDKINSIIAKNDEQDKTIKTQQELIDNQQKTIKELEKQNEELFKRIEKLEKQI